MNLPYAPASYRGRQVTNWAALLFCAILLTGGGALYLELRYEHAQRSLEVEALLEERKLLQRELEPLEAEALRLSRLERIDRIAREHLGMRPAHPAQVFELP